MAKLPPARFIELNIEAANATQPLTELEKFFALELTHASWELERVRANQPATAAELRLHAAYTRASRNWNRARRELAALQAARVSHASRLSPSRQQTAAATPLADATRVPMPKLANKMADLTLELIQKGNLPVEAVRLMSEQEAR